MKAISLWQPWASLWCSGCKVHETRHWPTSYRGWLAVHAAKKIVFDHGSRMNDILDGEFGGHWGLDLPRGAMIGIVKIVDCVPTQSLFKSAAAGDDDLECGDFSVGRWAWRTDDRKTFVTPIPYRGMQSMFTIPDSLIPKGLVQ